jgi:uncharacterized protein (DUF488 family)
MILDLYFAGEKSMLRTAIKKLKRLFKSIKEAGIQRHRKKLAQLADIEERERKALVDELTKKFAAAHAVCKRDNKTFTSVKLSVKEIIFVEGELATWSRYFREAEIYQPRPTGKV